MSVGNLSFLGSTLDPTPTDRILADDPTVVLYDLRRSRPGRHEAATVIRNRKLWLGPLTTYKMKCSWLCVTITALLLLL